MAGPAKGRIGRGCLFRAALPCLLPFALFDANARAQTLTTQGLFNPQRGAFVPQQDLPLRKTEVTAPSDALPALPDPNNDARPKRPGNNPETPAGSRIGKVLTYGLPAANGAADSGYDSLNRKRKPVKYYPGQKKPKPSPGPGTPPPQLNAAGELRLSIPPSESANKSPIPPAMAGKVDGQPTRRRLKIDDDPFGEVGDYAGSFLVKSAVELSGGYDTNPGRIFEPHGLPVYVVAPEFLAVSDWERHAVVADLRGSFTGYGGTLPKTIDGAIDPAPVNIDRPDFTGHVDGRLDVSEWTDLTAQARLLVLTDNPGSPNILAGMAKYPVFASFGGTLGFDQKFNRLQLSGGATIDRTVYQDSTLTDGSTSSNDDRNFNQYGGVARLSYELTPGVKPFVEAEGDTRVHDLQFDRNGFQRDSTGGYAKAGTSFEFSRLLTGEIAAGWAERTYTDTRLERLQGLLISSSLIWKATPLTTAKFISDTQIAETTLPGSAGTLVHTYTFEVDHDFRRFLTAIGKFTYGTYEYQGIGRNDRSTSTEGDLIYKLNRNFWIKGSLRYDTLESSVPQGSYDATVVMLGVRLQN